MQAIWHIFCGLVIGVANVIPGVSGGTMAVILNIYDQLIGAIRIKDLKKNLSLLIPVGLGGGLGILLFSKGIKFLYTNYQMITCFAFMGLILGSIPMIYQRTEAGKGKVRLPEIAAFVMALGIMLAMSFADRDSIANGIVTDLTLSYGIWLTFVSAVSAFAMLLPGVSGSFVMLILGTYTTVITAISDFNIPLLLPVAIGCAAGILLGARLVDLLMKRFPQATYSAILGLVIGSLFGIYPGFSWGGAGIIALLAMALTAWAAYFFSSRSH